jgi:type I restriction enzyme S subunit
MGWAKRTLGDVCEVKRGTTITKKTAISGDVPVVAGGLSPAYFHNKPNRPSHIITVSGSGANAGYVAFYDRPIFASDCSTVLPMDDTVLDVRFLYLFMLARQDYINNNLRQGAAQPHVYPKDLAQMEVWFPDMDEQQRIIANFEQIFTDLEMAHAYTEQNLKNVRELFESYLQRVFRQSEDGWFKSTVGEQITLQRGFDITKKQQNPGNVPVVSSGGIKSFHDEYKVEAPGVVIGRKGSLGTAYYVEQDFWPHDTTLWVKDFKGNDPRLVYYFFKGLDVKALDSGAANPALNRNTVHPITVSWPERGRQAKCVEMLDALAQHIAALEGHYHRKIEALNELKKSILKEAFSEKLENINKEAAA